MLAEQEQQALAPAAEGLGKRRSIGTEVPCLLDVGSASICCGGAVDSRSWFDLVLSDRKTNVKSQSNNCRCKAGVPHSGHHHHFNAHQAHRCAAASARPTHAWLTGFAESYFVVVLGKRMQPGQHREERVRQSQPDRKANHSIFWVEGLL